MKVTKIIQHDSDDCTYHCSTTIAIASNEDSARTWIDKNHKRILVKEYNFEKAIYSKYRWAYGTFGFGNYSPSFTLETVEVFE